VNKNELLAIAELENMRMFNYTLADETVFDVAIGAIICLSKMDELTLPAEANQLLQQYHKNPMSV